MRARRFSDCMHVRSTAVSEIRTLDMHARARFQRSNSVMHVFTVMHDQLCMMRALFNTSFTRILLALLLATSQTICTVAIEIVRRSKLRVSGLTSFLKSRSSRWQTKSHTFRCASWHEVARMGCFDWRDWMTMEEKARREEIQWKLHVIRDHGEFWCLLACRSFVV